MRQHLIKVFEIKRILLAFIILIIFNIIVAGQVGIGTENYSSGACFPQKILFRGFATGATDFIWSFGDGIKETTSTDTISHTYWHGGNFDLIVEAFGDSGFIGKSWIIVHIGGIDGYIGTSSDSSCIGEAIGFNLNGEIGSFNWNFGDPVSGDMNASSEKYPSHAFVAPGDYLVSLAGNTSCGTDTAYKRIYVGNDARPKANFWKSAKYVCPGDLVTFGMENSNAASFMWHFGDPSSGSADSSVSYNPSHIFSGVGKYVVSLKVQNSCGNSSIQVDTVYVTDHSGFPERIDIYANKGMEEISTCPGEKIEFYTSFSTNQMLWKFGNGDSSIQERAVYSYSMKGDYSLSLKLTNGCGIDTTIYKNIVIGKDGGFSGSPAIETSSPNTCPGDPLTFRFNSEAISYNWDFGDGFTSDKPSPNHSFFTQGTQIISLHVTNSCGSDTSISTSIQISDTLKPVLSHEKQNGNWGVLSNVACPGDTLLFYIFNSDHLTMDFGDGTSTSETEILPIDQGDVLICKHAYSNADTFIVSLTSFNSCGNSASDTLHIFIGGSVTIKGEMGIITNEPYFACQNIQFMAAMGSSFIWYLPDGDSIVSNQPILNYSFAEPGNYSMKLKMTNGCGYSALVERNLTVQQLPKPVILNHADTLFVKMDGREYQWYLDGSIIPGSTKDYHLIRKSGIYTIEVTGDKGCSSTSEGFPVCFVYAGSEISICPGGSAQLNAIGTENFSWSPSESLDNPSIANPVATPSSDTWYLVNGTSPGCSSIDSVLVKVVDALTANAGADITVCEGDSVLLHGSGGGAYSWTPQTGITNFDTPNPWVKPDTSTTYVLTVNSGNCSNSDSVKVTVQQHPVLELQYNGGVCAGSELAIKADFSFATGIEWKAAGQFEPGSSANEFLYMPTMGEVLEGSLHVFVNTTGSGICPAVSEQLSASIYNLPEFSSGIDQEICFGDTARIGTSAIQGLVYAWSPSGSLDDSTYAQPLATPSVSTDYILQGMDDHGCVKWDTVSVTVSSDTLPSLSMSASDFICAGDSIILMAVFDHAQGLNWEGDGEFIENDNHLSYVPTQAEILSGMAIVKVSTTGSGNCNAAEALAETKIYAIPNANAGSDQVVCKNSEALIGSSGNSIYACLWRPGTGLNDSTSGLTSVSVSESARYILTVKTEHGCTDLDTVVLEIANIETPVISALGDTLEISSGYSAYQWFLNENSIAGAVSNQLIATSSGSYSVAVYNENNCSAVSAGFEYTKSSVESGKKIFFRIYPNPATEILHVQSDELNANLSLITVDGRELLTRELTADDNIISLADISPGIYIIKIADNADVRFINLVKK